MSDWITLPVKLYGRKINVRQMKSTIKHSQLSTGRFIHFFLMYFKPLLNNSISFSRFKDSNTSISIDDFVCHIVRELSLSANEYQTIPELFFSHLLEIEHSISEKVNHDDYDKMVKVIKSIATNTPIHLTDIESISQIEALNLTKEMLLLYSPYVDSEEISYLGLHSDYFESLITLTKYYSR